MFKAQDFTIKRKLITIIMATSCLALLLVAVSFSVWSQVIARNSMVQNLSTQTAMIAENCQAALAFEDVEGAENVLASLKVIPSIVFGAIYNSDSMLFASYKEHEGVVPEICVHNSKGDYFFEKDRLVVHKSIMLDNEKIGTVALCSDLSPLRAMLIKDLRIILSLLVVASLVALGVSSRIQRVISVPILKLADLAKQVSEKNDYSVRAVKKSSDEIGTLIDSFNYMLEHIQAEINDRQKAEEKVIKLNETLEQRVVLRTAELEKTHKQLMIASRQAGMAEVATDVLHNVGNVLNSINVQTTLIEDKIKNSRVVNLKKAAEMIYGHLDDIADYLKTDQQGQLIPKYLCEVSQYMLEDQKEMLVKLSSLASNVNHIKEIISMQQSYAKTSGVSVITTVEELVDDSLQINLCGLARHGVEVVREHEDIGVVNLDRQRIVQILVNLIGNAKYAVSGTRSDDKKITIRSFVRENNCVIEVEDNGVGISDENLTKIFGHGFTTKENGHGFGLHSGAIAAKEMGGSLTVQSDGLGKGAKFILAVPYHPVEVNNNVKC